MEKDKLLVEIVESNLSSETKVFVMRIISNYFEALQEQKDKKIINPDILNPVGWSKKGKQVYDEMKGMYIGGQ